MSPISTTVEEFKYTIIKLLQQENALVVIYSFPNDKFKKIK